MFEQSLLDTGKGKGRRGATTLISFCLQILLVVVLILIPLIYTEALPAGQLAATLLVAPPPPPPPPPPPAAAVATVVHKIVSELDNGALRTPTKIPDKIKMIKEEEPPPPSAGPGFGVVGGIGGPGGQAGGVLGGVMSSIIAQPTVAQPKMATPQRIRVSQGVSEGMCVHRVQPTYPQLARQARIQGSVVLQAIISKGGTIDNLRLVQGHPMLAPAAMDAVKQWRYRPYFLNGEPVEVETVITVNFTLAGG